MSSQKIGDYTIVKTLGRGGFGSVWRAEAGTGEIVALKVLNPQVLDNQRVVKKFFHEAMILAKLDHPNICKLKEFFPDGDNYAIVMEYVEGVELKKLLKEHGLLPLNNALKLAKQTLSAFQYAFEQGIIHRDIKPGNIMITKSGDAKIMDFGIAKMSGAATHDTAAKMLSVHYVPPERFDPKKVIDQRSDIYSLGLVFYEIFAGRRAFMVDETSQIMFCHLNEIPEPPEKFNPKLPHPISQAILKALEKDPDDRFQDFQEFEQAIDPEGTPVKATARDDSTQAVDVSTLRPEPVTEEKLVRKEKKGLPVIPIVIAAVVIILGVAGFLLKDKFLGPSKVTETTVATAPPPKTPTGPVEKPHPADGAVMVQIPAGPFTMGSDKYSAEQPIQKIAMDPYWIDKYLVTNEMFKKFVDASGYKTDAEKSGGGMVRIGRRWRNVPEATWQMPDGLSPIDDKMDHPVAQVSYNDALAYCKWAKKDLPTEAQWEKAARGTDGRVFPWGDNPPDDTVANFDNIVGNTTPVKRYEKGASPFGLQDMAGNVYQWCKDWWGTGPRAEKNPTGPAKGKERVVKGGSFVEGEESLRSANRDRYAPDYSSYLFGFRCGCEDF